LPGDVPVGSADFVESLTSQLKSPPPLRRKWQRLAQLLREHDPLSPVARWLEDAARDGGLGRLQRLIVDHVAQHGLKQLLDYVRVAAEELYLATRRLPKKRPVRTGHSELTSDNIRQAVDGLYDVYTALKAEYEQAAPDLTVAVDGHPVSVQQRVHDQVTQSVFEWPVWNELLNKVQKDGTIQAIQMPKTQTKGGWDDGEEDTPLRLPSDSSEFFEPFRRTLAQNVAFADEAIRQAVGEQLQALAKRTQTLAEQLAPILGDEQSRKRVEEFDRQEKEAGRRAVGKGQFSVLAWAADPRSQEVCDRFLDRYVADSKGSIAPETCFALPGAYPEQTPLKFPWVRSQEPTGGNHQVLVLRLRDILADGMRRRVLQQVSQLSKQVLDGLKDTFTIWSERLLILSGNAPLLARLVGEAFDPSGAPQWKCAAVEYPLPPVPSEPEKSSRVRPDVRAAVVLQ